MNANKLFSEFSLKKIWDKLLQHDKAMSSTLLILNSGNWVEQEDDTFKNTVSYSTFKDTDKLTVDLYDDGNLSETQLTEYEQYIDSFEIVNGALVAIANTKPTQTFTVVIKGEFEVNKVEITSIECVNDFNSTEINVPASGNLARLLKEEINDCFQSVSNGKALVASAITDKGIETDANATFETMANNIIDISTGIGTNWTLLQTYTSNGGPDSGNYNDSRTYTVKEAGKYVAIYAFGGYGTQQAGSSFLTTTGNVLHSISSGTNSGYTNLVKIFFTEMNVGNTFKFAYPKQNNSRGLGLVYKID